MKMNKFIRFAVIWVACNLKSKKNSILNMILMPLEKLKTKYVIIYDYERAAKIRTIIKKIKKYE